MQIKSKHILWSGKGKRRLEMTRSGGCIEWFGFRDRWGYGMVANGKGGSMFAHRKAWEKHRGPIPQGDFVCHSCDNRACINPEHLFLGTPIDNNKDMEQKGRARHPKGQDHGRAKVSDDTVLLLRHLKGRRTYRELMQLSGLGKSQIYNILSGKRKTKYEQ